MSPRGSLPAGRLVRCLVVFCALGCAEDPDPEQCTPVPECPVVDEDATDEDVRVLWAGGQTISLTLDGTPSDVEVVGGEAVYTPDPSDLDCEGSCAITLKRLSVTLKNMYFVSSQESVKVNDLRIALRAPLELDDPDGEGSILPFDSEVVTCASVQDVPWASSSGLAEDGRFVARATNEELSAELVVPMTVNGSTSTGCSTFALELAGTLRGATPFDQNPTIAP